MTELKLKPLIEATNNNVHAAYAVWVKSWTALRDANEIVDATKVAYNKAKGIAAVLAIAVKTNGKALAKANKIADATADAADVTR